MAYDPLQPLSSTPPIHQPPLEVAVISTHYLQIPKKADMENWMYHLQGRAVGEIQLVSSWSHSLQHLEGSHIPVLELPWKLQPKVLGAQKNLLAYSILHIPVSFYLLGAWKPSRRAADACIHQVLDPLYLLDLLNTSSTALNPRPAYPQAS